MNVLYASSPTASTVAGYKAVTEVVTRTTVVSPVESQPASFEDGNKLLVSRNDRQVLKLV
jgi:hypothetical protein